MTELTILTVQLIVEFAKRIPGFEKLDQEDKITLLKVNLSRTSLLRLLKSRLKSIHAKKDQTSCHQQFGGSGKEKVEIHI